MLRLPISLELTSVKFLKSYNRLLYLLEYALRLAKFITSHTEPILQEWEVFARTLRPAALDMTAEQLRNHSALLLKFIAKNINTAQSVEQRIEKSHGTETAEQQDWGHGVARAESNFTIEQVVSEYRALRSSVLRLWAQSRPLTSPSDIDDVIRFDEAIDQLLASSVFAFAAARRKADEDEKDRRNNFLAMLGHELRNPLSPLNSAASILQSTRGNNPVIDKVSNVIARQVSHMASLIDDLLDVSRVTRGMIDVNLEEIDLRLVIGHAVEQVEPQIHARHQKLYVATPQEPAIVQADKKRIVQIVTNLLTNASKYTPESGHLQLKLQLLPVDIVILIEDDGVGMSPEFVPQAFELFAQAARTSDRSQGGLGLGLALVKNLVELHGGQVSCSSAGLGKGSQFTVRLPRTRPNDSNG